MPYVHIGFSTVLYISSLFSSERGEFFPISQFISLTDTSYKIIPVQEKYLMLHTTQSSAFEFWYQIGVVHRSFSKFVLISDICTVLELEHFGI